MRTHEDAHANSDNACSYHTSPDHTGSHNTGADHARPYYASTDHTSAHHAGTDHTGANSDPGVTRPAATAIYSPWSRFLGAGRRRFVRR